MLASAALSVVGLRPRSTLQSPLTVFSCLLSTRINLRVGRTRTLEEGPGSFFSPREYESWWVGKRRGSSPKHQHFHPCGNRLSVTVDIRQCDDLAGAAHPIQL